MEEFKQEQWEQFMKKILREAPQEAPSADFTPSVLSRIRKEHEEVITYKPLISKGVWGTIAVMGLLIVVLAYLGLIPSESNRLSLLLEDSVSVSSLLEHVPKLSVPRTVLYGTAALALAVFGQFYFFKHRSNHKIFWS